ncbi:MAG: class C sortase [Ruminococcus sp.]|nr:class C sortase [Ruminococcus sp.]
MTSSEKTEKVKPEPAKKKRSKIRVFFTILATLMLIVGIGLLLFPPVSNTYGKIVAESIADDFDKRVEIIEKNKNLKKSSDSDNSKNNFYYDNNDDGIDYQKIDIDALYKDSKAYNKNLRENQSSLLTNDYVFEKPALYLSHYGIYDGVYGYVNIPAIDLKIPIYLGIQNDHMSYGAAHLTYTSLPIGDNNSNCVLAAHTGYVGRIFFDNIRNLKAGDNVQVVNYWNKVNYTVTGHKIIKPNEAEDIFIEENKSKLVLMTCITNNSGGFDRYLVYCEKN